MGGDGQELELQVPLGEGTLSERIERALAKKLGTRAEDLPPWTLVRRAIDARGRNVHFVVRIRLGTNTEDDPDRLLPVASDPRGRVVIVGDGPAGLFCAYHLARQGIAATVIDRGKTVQPRRKDLKGLNQHGRVDEDSNYCFGEGGAGTYSDGKLYTRADKRGDVRDVMEILALHGAPPDILVDARPHIGSNKLPKVVTALRDRLEAVGVVFRFGQRVVGLESKQRGSERVIAGVKLASGEEVPANHVVLATGHSARDVFVFLDQAGVAMEAKPFAVGVRIEHPQPLINGIQYGRFKDHPDLPNAYYRLACETEGAKVFSFCMCPGGFIVPASTEPDGLVVNGMSLSKRNSPFANSGLVVGVEPGALAAAGYSGMFAGIDFQRRLERLGLEAGGGDLCAPAARIVDFVNRKASSHVGKTSYIPGIQAANMAHVLDGAGLPLSEAIRRSLEEFGRRMKGFMTEDAHLIGIESRTSSPIRILRDRESLESPTLKGLYPSGEGAGYAGGIVSAALDGISVAKRIAQHVDAST
jgi:uncharacterized protein